MSLTLLSLNGDTTFLLTFRATPSASYTLLLDPWLHSDAPVFHRAFSNQTHTLEPSISSLRELAAPPNGVLLSQDKSDHTHSRTLQELDWTAGQTHIYAVPGAAAVVRGWGWWQALGEDGRRRLRVLKKRERLRVPIAEAVAAAAAGPKRDDGGGDGGGDDGNCCYMELVLLPTRFPWQVPSLHSAIGIRFVAPAGEVNVLFSPHGSPLDCVRPWLEDLDGGKLDLMLWPWNRVANPWWLGGVISGGFPSGKPVCEAVEVGGWVSAHDEEKRVEGWVSGWIAKTRWNADEVGKSTDGRVKALKLGAGETATWGKA